jgi:hypothetical protein
MSQYDRPGYGLESKNNGLEDKISSTRRLNVVNRKFEIIV